MYNVQNLAYTFQAYLGEPTYLILFFSSLLYIGMRAEKESKRRIFWLIIFSVIFVYNDLSRMILEKFSEATYYRFLWMLPLMMVTAYVMVRVLSEQKRIWGKIFIIFAVGIMALQGSSILDGSTLRLPENKYNEAGYLRDEIILIRAANLGIKEESDVLSEALSAKNVDYIVTKTSYEMDEYFEEVGYTLVGRSDSRSIYGSVKDAKDM